MSPAVDNPSQLAPQPTTIHSAIVFMALGSSIISYGVKLTVTRWIDDMDGGQVS